MGFREFAKTAWRLFKPYWKSDRRREAWLYSAGILALTLLSTAFSVAISFVIAQFFTALEQRDIPAFFNGLLLMFGAVVILVLIAMFKTQLTMSFQIAWRRWLTHNYFNRYCERLNFYQLELTAYGVDNADQRISEDIRNFCVETTELGLEFLREFLTLFSFVAVLWAITGPLEFTLFGADISIPGYMVWVAILYTIVGTWIGHIIAKPLTRLNFRLQANEADLRFSLMRVRENAEAVALSKGIEHEKTALRSLLDTIVGTWMSLVRYTKRLHAYQAFFGQLNFFFPIMAGSPRFFSGAIEFGVLIQTAQAFQQVQGALAWFLTAYERLAKWKSSVDRLLTLDTALVEASNDRSKSNLQHDHTRASDGVSLDDLSIWLPDGRKLLDESNQVFPVGKSVMISGRSGIGKTTLFRVLSGLWPWSSGRVRIPENSVFLSQRPYLPLGSLRNAIAYPGAETDVATEEVVRLFESCSMEQYGDRLDETESWAKILSGGEQQRIGIVRAILQRPTFLFLDEATTAMDLETEAQIYRLLKEELPGTAVVSIAHRESLKQYHDHFVEFDGQGLVLVATHSAQGDTF
ncbi:MAG: ABC transporter ATP-binding protein/permease [Gammaproteobacteria bacterium]|nr:ABC transporter ATP-binding protein/permease [Gammaproteobacteria bacterium]